MTRTEIVAELGKRKAVEEMVSRITRRGGAIGHAGHDLAQMVYMILLTYDEDKIVDLWENDQLGFFIARVIKVQAFSRKSPFWYAFRNFSAKSEDITARDFKA